MTPHPGTVDIPRVMPLVPGSKLNLPVVRPRTSGATTCWSGSTATTQPQTLVASPTGDGRASLLSSWARRRSGSKPEELIGRSDKPDEASNVAR